MSKKILDIGCGRNKYPNSIGIDINPKFNPDIILDINYDKLPFKDNSIDKVVCIQSIEHFGNPLHIFKEVYRVLKKGGIFHIETINVAVWWIRLLFFIDWNKGWRHKIGTDRTPHLIHWTPDTLSMWFELNNFKKIKKKKANHFFHYKIIIEGIK